METNNTTHTRIRIEYMTLGQIQDLKNDIAHEVESYLDRLYEIISSMFDVGAIRFSVDYEINGNKTECDAEIPTSTVSHKTRIYFGKEDISCETD